MARLTRRAVLGGLAPLVGAGVAARLAGFPGPAAAAEQHAGHGGAAGGGGRYDGRAGEDLNGHAGFRRGTRVDPRANGFDPMRILRDFDEGKVRREGGRTVRARTRS
jgi:hypothetical protein